MNARENKVYATVLAIPDYRFNPNSHTVMTFGETGAGCPAAVKAWFYPGDNTGNRFVYGKKEAEEMSKSCRQPVPHVANEVAIGGREGAGSKAVEFDRAGGSCAGSGADHDDDTRGKGRELYAARRLQKPTPRTAAESPVRSRARLRLQSSQRAARKSPASLRSEASC